MSAPAMKVRPAPATTIAGDGRIGGGRVQGGRQRFGHPGTQRVDRRVVDADDGHMAVEAQVTGVLMDLAGRRS